MKIQEMTWHLPVNKFKASDKLGNDKEFTKKDGAFFVLSVSPSFIEFTHQKTTYIAKSDIKIKKALYLDDIEPHIIFKCITGSQAYGTNLPTSDIDYKGVYVLPDEYIKAVTFDPDWEEVKVKDLDNNSETTYYEIRKFLRLIQENNPNVLEVFNLPPECIITKSHIFDEILKYEKDFLTKECYERFLGYANEQIGKAKGQNKKQNWLKDRMERKTVLDFCFTFKNQGSQPIKDWLADRHFKQENCGITAIDHMRETYGLYYGEGLYNGIVSNENLANDISLSETPKGATPICYMQFNKDGYSTHCKDYKSYQTWLKEKNEQRWVDVKEHGQKIDGKNMLHCVRLIMMAEDIAEGRGIIVRRPEAEYLKSIRKGEVSLEDLIKWSTDKLVELKTKFENSNLPDEVDPKIIQEIYDQILWSIQTDKYIYELKKSKELGQ